MTSRLLLRSSLVALGALFAASAPAAAPTQKTETAVAPSAPAPVEPVQVEGVYRVHRVGRLLLAGQPDSAGLERLAKDGVRRVIDLRKAGEVTDFDEPARVEALGMSYLNLGFVGPEELTPGLFDSVRELLRNPGEGDTVLHCGSANRVGAVWIAARTLDEGVDWPTALAEAKTIGLRSTGYRLRARDYVRRHQRPEWAAVLDDVRKAHPKVKQLAADDLEVELAGEAPPLLLDVRSAEEFAVSHLPGAQRAEDAAAALTILGDSPEDRAIVTYCSVGKRSSILAEKLMELGYPNVSNLEGSIFEWANEARPLRRGDLPVREAHPYDERWGRFLNEPLRAMKPRPTGENAANGR